MVVRDGCEFHLCVRLSSVSLVSLFPSSPVSPVSFTGRSLSDEEKITFVHAPSNSLSFSISLSQAPSVDSVCG